MALVECSTYDEYLELKPLLRNNILSSFNFKLTSNGIISNRTDINHYDIFPSSLGPLLETTNTQELHLRFTQGFWDHEIWGRLPFDGFKSGGTGVEVWANMNGDTKDEVYQNWIILANSLSAFFCASLNFIDSSTTTFPRSCFSSNSTIDINNNNNNNTSYLLRSALPREPVCTENLTPFLKLLPTRGKAGISSLLDGHKVFDAEWNSMSIDIIKRMKEDQTLIYEMDIKINLVVNIPKKLSKNINQIPKPIPGEELRCDPTKKSDIYHCFPLDEPVNYEWDLETLFGKDINGGIYISERQSRVCMANVDENYWKISGIKKKNDDLTFLEPKVLTDSYGTCFELEDAAYNYDIKFETSDSTKLPPMEPIPITVSRSLTGYSQDSGGFRTIFQNPSSTETELIYFETMPWYMRVYLHTMELTIVNNINKTKNVYHIINSEFDEKNKVIKNVYYKPEKDRSKPSHLELTLMIPADSTVTITYQFDKSLLLYAEYPPDANHGFDIDPAVVTVLDESRKEVYQLRTTSLLLTLPTPDFSMPYNVIILTSTIMTLIFGALFNMLIKRVLSVEEYDEIVGQSSIISKLKTRIQLFKKKLTGKTD
ncbi:hypothetical protein PACTADRAFT_51907 [Pachysolen tannophilus NRRL Y-2460]|uniref:GPI transamidase component GPI16 n=1 Tax=Pachysolen tannophilus NRRL Y-2460 TaxID=669874 RepID=A0A1E4TNP3_PACTA|nr:hypothetical protein PACTADRAFT_51907 [Pachysolen tannophilus NRRL Y-2460]